MFVLRTTMPINIRGKMTKYPHPVANRFTTISPSKQSWIVCNLHKTSHHPVGWPVSRFFKDLVRLCSHGTCASVASCALNILQLTLVPNSHLTSYPSKTNAFTTDQKRRRTTLQKWQVSWNRFWAHIYAPIQGRSGATAVSCQLFRNPTILSFGPLSCRIGTPKSLISKFVPGDTYSYI